MDFKKIEKWDGIAYEILDDVEDEEERVDVAAVLLGKLVSTIQDSAAVNESVVGLLERYDELDLPEDEY